VRPYFGTAIQECQSEALTAKASLPPEISAAISQFGACAGRGNIFSRNFILTEKQAAFILYQDHFIEHVVSFVSNILQGNCCL